MFKFGPSDKVIDFKYFPPLIAMAQDEGVSLEQLLVGTGLPEDVISDDSYKASAEQVAQLLKNIVKHCRPGLSLEFGKHLNLSAFGVVGFAALSSPTARDAIYIAHRYMPVVLPLLELNVDEKSDITAISLTISYPMEPLAEAALLEVTFSSLYAMSSFILQDNMPSVRLEVIHRVCQYHRDFVEPLKATMIGGCSTNRVIVPTRVLDTASPLANKSTFNSSIKACDQLMAELPELDKSLTAGIQRRLLYYDGECPLTQEAVAKELFMSPRTMHRLLQREGASFREIQKQTNLIRAKRLLAQNQLSLSHIALELGYSDAANFTRAFRSQTGMTPSAYRKSVSV